MSICTNCGKGELQEITGTALLYCPVCDSKLIALEKKKEDGSYVIDTKMSKEEWDAMAPEFKLKWLTYLEKNEKRIGTI